MAKITPGTVKDTLKSDADVVLALKDKKVKLEAKKADLDAKHLEKNKKCNDILEKIKLLKEEYHKITQEEIAPIILEKVQVESKLTALNELL